MTVQKDSAIKKQDVNGNQKKVNSSTKNDANKNEFKHPSVQCRFKIVRDQSCMSLSKRDLPPTNIQKRNDKFQFFFKKRKVPADGDCFYHSVIRCLDLKTTPTILRQCLLDFLKLPENKLFNDIDPRLSYRIQKGIDARGDEESYAEEIEIMLMARMINIRIFVHKPNIKKHEYKWEMFDPMIEFVKPLPNAFIGNVIFIENRQTHYDSLQIQKNKNLTNVVKNKRVTIVKANTSVKK